MLSTNIIAVTTQSSDIKSEIVKYILCSNDNFI